MARGADVVPTLIDGTGPVDFMRDTGADETAAFAWLANQLHLPAVGSGQVSAATGSSDTVLSRIATRHSPRRRGSIRSRPRSTTATRPAARRARP